MALSFLRESTDDVLSWDVAYGNGFTDKSSAYAAMKLYQAVRAAKDLLQASPSSPLASAASGVRSLPLTEVLCERPHLEKEFEEKWKAPKPQIRDQGSDALLKRQYKFCSKGQTVSEP